MENTAPKLASTIILHRYTAEAEIYMLRRSSKASFMPNALVFPGGGLDESDHTDSWVRRSDLEYADAQKQMWVKDERLAHALMVAAVRETFEESGILLTTEQNSDFEIRAMLRKELNSGKRSFLSIIESLALTLDLNGLTFVSRWVTPEVERKRFDAYFFIAEAPTDHVGASADGSETFAGRWKTPASILKAHSERSIQLAPPTLRAIQTLALTPSPDWSTLRRSHAHAICPQFDESKPVPTLLMPGDPDFDPPGTQPNKFELHDGYWRSVGVGF